MTFTDPGVTPVTGSGESFSLTPHASGDFVLLEVIYSGGTTDYATGASSTNATWTVLVAHTTVSGGTATVLIGKTTSTSTATVTISVNGGTAGDFTFCAKEFATSAGYSAVTLNTSGSSAGVATFPSLTPGHGTGELYFGYMFDDGTASAGTTSGYTYHTDAVGGLAAWNPSCGSGAQQPNHGDGGNLYGIAVLLYEAVTASPPGLLMAGII